MNSGTDWLRSLVRRKPKHATGGIITADQAPILREDGCDYAVPTTMLGIDGKFVSVTNVELEVTYDLRKPSPADVERIAQQLDVVIVEKGAPEPERVRPSREHTAEITRQANDEARRERIDATCPCLAIYSSCRCKR